MAAERAAQGRATWLTVPAERLREVIAELRRQGVTYAQIATDAGLGVSTVWQFVHGSTPQPKTHTKLANWYQRRRVMAAAETTAVDPTLADLVMRVLTRDLHPRRRGEFVRELIVLYEVTLGVPAPDWLTALRASDR